ncbi:hypothetical protein C8Q70DRAFT_1058837 [Cubamyces menziesii]|nr:hypothetical protein C8Q70DRAFT_1058837 [Cubamyces menziesii]
MPFHMDAKALATLPSPALRNFAERVGVEANERKKDIIRALVDKYHPMLVPYEPDSVTSSPKSTSSRSARPQSATGISLKQSVPASTSTIAAHSSNRPGRGTDSPIRPTLQELQGALDTIAPLAQGEGEAHEQLRELQLLLSSIGRRTAMLVERGQRLRRFRLALERHRPELERLRPLEGGAQAAHMEENGRSEEMDEEEELLEVEEMTSREVDLSDLPSTPDGDGDMAGRGQKRKRGADDASPNDSPRKRTRARSSV